MKRALYPRLALSGIRKNARLYLPALCADAGMAMVCYIVACLRDSSSVASMRGGAVVTGTLSFGVYVIAVFSLLFLLYTNAFLIRRRKREFGLYSILGMDKRGIARILTWEMLIVAGVSIASGLALGIVLSKLAELALANIMNSQISYRLPISLNAIKNVALFFGAIHLLVYLISALRVHAASPSQLMKGENLGEKPPKANYLLGFAGLILLASAYVIAVRIKDPISALLWFFLAVLMVIVATYLIFIAGSVMLCRILQKNKKYYYKSNHFISVSSMAYRMKRNGAGLASICILATMALVTVASTACLYFGEEDALLLRYPRQISVDAHLEPDRDDVAALDHHIQQQLADFGVCPENIRAQHTAYITGIFENGTLNIDWQDADLTSIDRVCQVCVMSAQDYIAATGRELPTQDGEAWICGVRTSYPFDTITLPGSLKWRVAGELKQTDVPASGLAAMNVMSTLFVLVPDYETAAEAMYAYTDGRGARSYTLHWEYGFDAQISADEEIALYYALYDDVRALIDDNAICGASVESRAEARDDFYATFGSLFFLGALLSLVFVCAAALIIYYKQISEGYEDQARFGIMQKVGMTRRDIRRSINSQMLTVFFMPLAVSALHLGFALPMVRKILMLFNLNNLPLLLCTAGISFAAFSALYLLVYRITVRAYGGIVSGAQRD